MSDFEKMAVEDPAKLLDLVGFDSLDNSDLTFAAEAAGNIILDNVHLNPLAKLLSLTKHSSAVVREGALLGLSQLIYNIKERIKVLAENDPSPGVQTTAREILL